MERLFYMLFTRGPRLTSESEDIFNLTADRQAKRRLAALSPTKIKRLRALLLGLRRQPMLIHCLLHMRIPLDSHGPVRKYSRGGARAARPSAGLAGASS